MRDYSITRNEGELYEVKVVDSYGKKYKNWFEHAYECSEWIYYIWENEDKFVEMTKNKDKLLANAIKECKKIDKNANRRAIL